MHPHLEIFAVAGSGYALAWAVGGQLAAWLAFRRMLRLHPPLRATAIIVAGTVAGLLGSRALVVALRVAAGAGLGSEGVAGDISVLGFQIFGAFATLAVLRGGGWPVGRTFDLLIPGMPLLQAVGRVGCLLQGCCGGREAAGWLAMTLPGGDGRVVPRYPTQLAASLAQFAILAALLLVERRAGRRSGLPFPGFLTVLYGILACAERFVIELWREPTLPPFGPFTWAQVVCLLGLGVGAALLALNLARARRTIG